MLKLSTGSLEYLLPLPTRTGRLSPWGWKRFRFGPRIFGSEFFALLTPVFSLRAGPDGLDFFAWLKMIGGRHCWQERQRTVVSLRGSQEELTTITQEIANQGFLALQIDVSGCREKEAKDKIQTVWELGGQLPVIVRISNTQLSSGLPQSLATWNLKPVAALVVDFYSIRPRAVTLPLIMSDILDLEDIKAARRENQARVFVFDPIVSWPRAFKWARLATEQQLGQPSCPARSVFRTV